MIPCYVKLLLLYYLNGLPGRVSVPQQPVSCGLDSVHLLLPQLQLSHQPLRPRQSQSQSQRRHHHRKTATATRHHTGAAAAYRVVLFLGCHVGVSFAPVVVDLLFLLVVQPNQLFGGSYDEGVELVQVVQTGLGVVLQSNRCGTF